MFCAVHSEEDKSIDVPSEDFQAILHENGSCSINAQGLTEVATVLQQACKTTSFTLSGISFFDHQLWFSEKDFDTAKVNPFLYQTMETMHMKNMRKMQKIRKVLKDAEESSSWNVSNNRKCI
jgi:hypothetical protein